MDNDSITQTNQTTESKINLYNLAIFKHLSDHLAYLRAETARVEELLTDHALAGVVEALKVER